MKEVSVVVLTYTRFHDAAERCLHSLASDPDFRDWELKLVDNGSDIAEQRAIGEAATRFDNLDIVRLNQNAGFPGGMNAGLAEATGEFIFLVSSDVLVPNGTVRRLVDAMKAHPNAGLVAPVSNAAGNEQQISIEPDLPVAGVLEAGRDFADAGGLAVSGLVAHRLDFCFVCLRRNVYQSIGGLDEAFNPGYYEDFDYSLRVRDSGHGVLISENAFVFHEGGATFGRDSKEKKLLIKRNKKYFLSKHGSNVWMPHVRDANLAILNQYADRVGTKMAPPLMRVQNRLALAHSNQPRSFFKGRRYHRRLVAVESRLAPLIKSEKARS